EQRLDDLTGGPKVKSDPAQGILLRPPIDLGQSTFWFKLIPNVENLNRLYEQADVNLDFKRFLAIVVVLMVGGVGAGVAMKLPPLVIPLGALFLGFLPFFWLLHRRRVRIRKFLEAMPEAVELISRALRAGHSLASGMRLVAEELKGPIADE